MKKRFTIAFAALLVFGLAIVAFAFTKANNTNQTSAAVSCPMQEKHHASKTTENGANKDSCGMADCCRDGKCSMGGACCQSGDSCPMKDAKNAAGTDYSRITFSDNAAKDDCCATGASCCAGGAGACCKGKRS
ncbi:MAG TPA: hypothetical protein VF692_05930 [Pyrinomonadaceae bacterium]|jgi:hypothetical protein